jgi:death-on-curing protein
MARRAKSARKISSRKQRWLAVDVVLALHDAQLAEHGGAPGMRDEGLLASALARPQNLTGYGQPDLADLAAAYAYDIVRSHAFVDGNKRTGFLAAVVFLMDNGHRLEAPHEEALAIMLDTAAGRVEEAVLSAWLRTHLKRSAI